MRYRGRRWNKHTHVKRDRFYWGAQPSYFDRKAYLIEPEPEQQVISLSPFVKPGAELQALYFAGRVIGASEDGQWSYQLKGSAPAQHVLKTRSTMATACWHRGWPQTYTDLASQLTTPHTIEVWYQASAEEPQRITYYQLPEFWLLKNWNDQWLAVSIEESYLFQVLAKTIPQHRTIRLCLNYPKSKCWRGIPPHLVWRDH